MDRAYQILRYHCKDDKLVKETYSRFKSGEMTSGELKAEVIKFVNGFLKGHQEKGSLQ